MLPQRNRKKTMQTLDNANRSYQQTKVVRWQKNSIRHWRVLLLLLLLLLRRLMRYYDCFEIANANERYIRSLYFFLTDCAALGLSSPWKRLMAFLRAIACSLAAGWLTRSLVCSFCSKARPLAAWRTGERERQEEREK